MPSASTTRNNRTKRLPAPPSDEITLQIIGAEHHGRLVRITSAKCTVGSAPGCTLRLKANGVAPLHCLILRGPNGVVVRRMADDVLLNGRPFDDAPLAVNDHLEVGSVTFVVLHVPLSLRAAEERSATEPQQLAEEARELVRETRRRAKLRARTLLNALRAGKRQAEQLQRQIESRKLEFEQAARQTAALNRELTAQRDRQRSTEDEQRAAVLQVSQLTASLERLRHELLAVQSQRQSEADRWRLDRSRMTEDLALRESRLHEAEGQLQQKQWELEQLHLQFQRQQRQLELEHEQTIAARQRREKDAETTQLELARVNEELLAQDRARLQAQSDLQTAQRELDAMREVTTQLRGELQTRTEELAQLREANERSVRDWQIERLKIVQEVGQAAAHDARLLTEHRKQLEDATTQVRELEAKLAEAQVAAIARDAEHQAQWRRELDDAKALARQYEAQITELRKATTERDAELAALSDELAAERQARASEQEVRLESDRLAAETAAATQRRMNELQANFEQVEALLAERNAELARLQSEQREQTIQWSTAQSQVAEVEAAATERLRTLETELSAAREEAANAAAELAAKLTFETESKRQAETEQELLHAELTALQSQVSELQTSLSGAQGDLATAREALTGVRAELDEVRARELQTIVYSKAEPETPAIDPEEVAALERKAEELAALEARLAESRAELTREREAFAAEVEQSRNDLRSRAEHMDSESSRISAGMHQLLEFEARLAQQQDELSRQQREWEAREVAAPVAVTEDAPPRIVEPVAETTDDEAGFLMPVDSLPHDDTPPPTKTASSAPEVTQPYFASRTEASEILEPYTDEPAAEIESEEEPPRMVTQPYFGPITTREEEPESPPMNFLPPQEPAEEPVAEIAPVVEPENEPTPAAPESESQFLAPSAPEETAEEPSSGSSAFERRLAALAAEAAKARGTTTFEDPKPEPPAPEPQPASESTGELIAPIESPAAPAISPDLLPQWRFEHETPDRMDTITGLRMRNLLDDIKNFPADVGGIGETRPKTLADMIPQPSAMKLQLDSPTAAEPTPPPVIDEPLEDIDIFSRLKEAGILKSEPVAPIQLPPREESAPRSFLPPPDAVVDEEPEQMRTSAFGMQDQVELPPTPAGETPNPFAASKPAEAAGEEEESIEDYMQQLLKRVRGDGPPTGTGANPVYRAAATPASSSEAPKKNPAPPPPKPDLPPVKPEEYVPRSTAAERTVNLAAMRELANSQARNAIQTHQKKVGLQLSGGKLITAVVALITAVVLVWSGLTNNLRLTMAAGGLGAVIGLYWLMQAMFFSLGWKLGGRK